MAAVSIKFIIPPKTLSTNIKMPLFLFLRQLRSSRRRSSSYISCWSGFAVLKRGTGDRYLVATNLDFSRGFLRYKRTLFQDTGLLRRLAVPIRHCSSKGQEKTIRERLEKVKELLDGYIARNFKNQGSMFGTVLDPMADKILMSVLTISLTVAGLLPVPLTALIISRDGLLIGASFYFRFKSLPPPKTISRYFDVNLATVELRPNFLGKANTVLQLGLVGCTLLAPLLGFVDHPYLQGYWYVVGASTIMSSISYLFASKTAVRYIS
ncbi:cardiolipin synthase (CMP-forming) isoform X2 [Nematostella vectensis]|uniref:cardiolipin synthase (CMP-forming) isoform X2 n=1 Tax=Nematostella vectensis TaxID=45351 RepID=UPI00138FF135|nr:cardiolipin synthase (CMP-forming) isoform X2 [Nematostella vectensis]